jgi:GntR family transcriptional repressor for pyruvate dehydrogenase complex
MPTPKLPSANRQARRSKLRSKPPPAGSERNAFPWRSARSEPAASRIERQIKEAILNGQFKVGDYIGSEHDLSTELGVSRLPVREALNRLQALGLVDVTTGAAGGARVAAGRPHHIAELLVIQLVLEGLDPNHVLAAQRIVEVAAAEMAARGAGAQRVARLEQALEEAERLVDSPGGFTAASMAFHAAVGEASGNQFLSIMMQAIALALERINAPDTTTEIARSVVARHRKLLQAIKAGDAVESVQLISRHLDRVHSRIRARLASGPAGNRD